MESKARGRALDCPASETERKSLRLPWQGLTLSNRPEKSQEGGGSMFPSKCLNAHGMRSFQDGSSRNFTPSSFGFPLSPVPGWAPSIFDDPSISLTSFCRRLYPILKRVLTGSAERGKNRGCEYDRIGEMGQSVLRGLYKLKPPLLAGCRGVLSQAFLEGGFGFTGIKHWEFISQLGFPRRTWYAG